MRTHFPIRQKHRGLPSATCHPHYLVLYEVPNALHQCKNPMNKTMFPRCWLVDKPLYKRKKHSKPWLSCCYQIHFETLHIAKWLQDDISWYFIHHNDCIKLTCCSFVVTISSVCAANPHLFGRIPQRVALWVAPWCRFCTMDCATALLNFREILRCVRSANRPDSGGTRAKVQVTVNNFKVYKIM